MYCTVKTAFGGRLHVASTILNVITLGSRINVGGIINVQGGVTAKINNRTGDNKRTARKSKLKLIIVQEVKNVQGE